MRRIDQEILRVLAAARLEGEGWMSVVAIWTTTKTRMRVPIVRVDSRLDRMLSQGLVETKWGTADARGNRPRLYRITKQGANERATASRRRRRRWALPLGRPGLARRARGE